MTILLHIPSESASEKKTENRSPFRKVMDNIYLQ